MALALIGFAALFVATSGEHAVPSTVVDDATLPAIEINGLRLHAEVQGPPDAPVTIVLHGGPGGDYVGLLPLKALADKHRVVFYDQRGAGLSQRVPAETLMLDTYIQELAGVIAHYSPNRSVTLIGHSWGAMLASAYMAPIPSRLNASF